MRNFLLVFILLISTGCEQSSTEKKTETIVHTTPETTVKVRDQDVAADKAKQIVTLVEFQESEPGIDPYHTRMLISDDYIRIDEADSDDGFVLFDRKNKRIYSIVDSDHQILVVDPVRPLGELPKDLSIENQQIEDDKIPLIDGKKPEYFQFSANGSQCYHVIAVDGLLPDVVTALTEYQRVLAAQQLETLDNTPKELQTPCFLANYIYAVVDYLGQGFPIEQWDEITGYRRSLIRYDVKYPVAEGIFKIPEDMQFYTMGAQGGIAL